MSTVCCDLPREAASLSSGTIAGLLRDGALEYGYRCAECWVIDQYQSRFVWFCRHCDLGDHAESWMDAWRAYVANIRKYRQSWKCGYQGETDYRLGNDRYSVRGHALPHVTYNGDYFETGIMKHLGCIWWGNCGHLDGRHEFPANDVIAAFPGYVPLGATYDWDVDEDGTKVVVNWRYIYHDDFGKPAAHLVRHWSSGSIRDYCTPMADVDYDRLDYDRDIAPYKQGRCIAS